MAVCPRERASSPWCKLRPHGRDLPPHPIGSKNGEFSSKMLIGFYSQSKEQATLHFIKQEKRSTEQSLRQDGTIGKVKGIRERKECLSLLDLPYISHWPRVKNLDTFDQISQVPRSYVLSFLRSITNRVIKSAIQKQTNKINS